MKKITAILVATVFVFVAVSAGLAIAQDAQQQQAQQPKEDAAHRAVGGAMKTVGEASIGTTKTAVSPLVAFWRSITGRGTPDKIVTDPVEQGGKTVYDASKNTGETVTGQNQ